MVSRLEMPLLKRGVSNMSEREPYYATEIYENNAPNVWAVFKRATPGARQFNGEVLAKCKDEATARMFARLINKEARNASAVCDECESINTHSSFCPRYQEAI